MRRAAACALLLVTAIWCAGPATALTPAEPRTSVSCSPGAEAQTARVWDVAATRLAALAKPSRSIPFGATGGGPYQRTNAYAWTSGFYAASLWLMYERTREDSWLALARKFTAKVLPVAAWTGTHDLGFMVGLPATLGMRLDPMRAQRYRAAILTAARSLSTRWNGNVGATKSGEYGGRWGVIIDSAMNAPMLIEAAALTSGAESRRLAGRRLRHLVTLAETFVRPDGSTVHRQVFNTRTGELIGPVPGQGLSTRSTWARGQAWAISGFTRGYELTRDARLLEAARRVSDYWLQHVPAGCVPAWDLDVESDRAPRDSSAAAIAADGLFALGRADPDPDRAARYLAAGMQTLATLTQTAWVPDVGTASGVLQRQAYSIPGDGREGTYVWGDAYLLLGLAGSAQ